MCPIIPNKEKNTLKLYFHKCKSSVCTEVPLVSSRSMPNFVICGENKQRKSTIATQPKSKVPFSNIIIGMRYLCEKGRELTLLLQHSPYGLYWSCSSRKRKIVASSHQKQNQKRLLHLNQSSKFTQAVFYCYLTLILWGVMVANKSCSRLLAAFARWN